ncbi:Zinc finger CCCH domain-containing protein 6 [Acipenser ruthenus]|uniref:Zinc finger CCCH domain-containing protein 6 n=1 Tax=Acipenser ruthenus TaxID=7906 RepID=A0A444UPV2_ACIRT|nr:Zinc finger CCCH domain-containing protein 6 [Acipenser ruthenus]
MRVFNLLVVCFHNREDGELEDGEIDDEGIGIEDEGKELKEENKDKDEKPHKKSRKKHRQDRDKRKAKKRRRDRHKHHSPSSGDSSDYSYESDFEHSERQHKKPCPAFRDYNTPFPPHGQSSGGYMKPQNPAHNINHEFDKFSDYGEEKYDYGEDADFADELNQYRHAKETTAPGPVKGPPQGQMKKQSMKGVQKGPGQKGKGRGVGRGRGMQKNKKQKGKNWGRGRGRGADQGGGGSKEDKKGPVNAQKKRPIMSQEFINQHTVEHNGRYICKYFLDGRCIKEDQCKFEHDLVVPDKKKEMCKFYIQGYCSKGENCIYMHNILRFFHTGAKCYQGDNCKFSHEPLTDVTRELLEKVLNTEEDKMNEDKMELEDLWKQGISPLPKPPPGVGLLPTPGPEGSPCQGGQKKIPSLFEIVVQPTVDLAQKIGLRPNFYNSSSPPGPQFHGNAPPPEQMFGGGQDDMPPGPNGPPVPPGSPGSFGQPCHVGPPGVYCPPMPQIPPGQSMPCSFPGPHNLPPVHSQSTDAPLLEPSFSGLQGNAHGNRLRENPQQTLLPAPGPAYQQMPADQPMQLNIPYQAMQNPADFFNNYYSNQAVHSLEPTEFTEEEALTMDKLAYSSMQDSQQSGTESDSSSNQKRAVHVPDFLPAMQKALFLRLSQKQHEEEHHKKENQGQEMVRKEKDETVNWYSSDDEEDGSSVTSILKTLKKQSDILKNQQQSVTTQQSVCDPRLQKEKNAPSDPRMKCDLRDSASREMRKSTDAASSESRLVRNARKIKPQVSPRPRSHSHVKQPVGDDDEDGERELRENAANIPLEPLPGLARRDPRCQLKQFSHIKVDVILYKPAFAKHVVWAPEDLIPLPLPKQEHSINLPLPPLIAEARLNKCHNVLSDSNQNVMPLDHRRAKDIKTEVCGHINKPPDTKASDKPLDPQMHKALDPRLHRSFSMDSQHCATKDSHFGIDPCISRGNGSLQSSGTVPVKLEQDKLPPYAPKLSSTGGGLGSPTTLLGGISLYDPRNKNQLSSKEDEEHPKKVNIMKHPSKQEHAQSSLLPVSNVVSAPDSMSADSSDASADKYNSYNKHRPTPRTANPPPASAVHNLPIAALAGLIRPPYTDPRQTRQTGQASQPQESDLKGEPDDKPLKDMFKTFDPTASPFC